MRAAIYVRISDDRTGAGLGVERQRKDCARLCKDKGWEVAGTYADNDVSAYSGRARPEYQRMLDDAGRGTFDVIVAWHTDRLHRRPIELEEFIATCESVSPPITVHTVQAGPIDLSTASGRVVARTLGAFARYESEHKADRLRRKHAELALAGKPSGGQRAYGYAINGVDVVEKEAGVIRDAARRLLAGEGVNSICKDLNARGIPTARNKQWRTATLKAMLCSARISGQREHTPRTSGRVRGTGEIVAKASWPAIITAEETAAIRALFAARLRPSQPVPRKRLLTGLLRCGHCGAGLKSRPQNGVPRYECLKMPGRPGCGRLAIVGGPVDELVVEMVLVALGDPKIIKELRRPTRPVNSRTKIEKEMSALRRRQDGLATDFADGHISRREWMSARRRIEDRLAELTASIEGVHRSPVDDLPVEDETALRVAWDGMTMGQRRAVLDAVLDRVLVHPAKTRGRPTFDPDRIEPIWLA